MSNASSQAHQFYDQVVAERRVFTFLLDGGFLVYPMQEGEVVPFWSSRSRLEQIQKQHAKYRNFTIDEIAYDKFKNVTLPDLRGDGIRVGINWSGARLRGYDISVADLIANLEHREQTE